MNTKLFWLTVFALLAVSIHTATNNDDDDYDFIPGFSDPEVDPLFINTFDRSIEDTDTDGEQADADTVTPVDAAGQDDSQDTQGSSSSSGEIPENERIHQDGVIFDGQYHSFNTKPCGSVQILLNKKDLEIRANSVFNAEAILVTSTPLDECDEISIYDCPENVPDKSFCKVHNLHGDDDMEGLKLGSEVCDAEVLYLYPIPEDQSISSIEFEVKIIAGDERQCDADSSISSADEFAAAEAMCSTYTTIDTCQPTQNACASQCMWITCGIKAEEDGPATNTSTSCVPLISSEDQLQAKCEANTDFSAAMEDDQVIDYPICEAAERAEDDDAPSIIYHPLSQIIGLTFLAVFILFLVVVCFYRCQFRKYGEGPFSPPNCCPTFIFPRQKLPGFMTISTDKRDKRHEMIEYEPPVPVL